MRRAVGRSGDDGRVSPGARLAILVVGVIFCAAFGAATLYTMSSVDFQTSILIFGIPALVIDLLILLGLIGAILHPPERRR